MDEEIRKVARQLGIPDDVPILDIGNDNIEDDLAFFLNTQGSASDYRNDRGRPYNGQAHTDEGERGKQLVEGLTMRDIKDCFVMAMLDSCGGEDENLVLYQKAQNGTWRHQDVYKIVGDLDPLAVAQNLTCRIEKMMGIYPNIPKSRIAKPPEAADED